MERNAAVFIEFRAPFSMWTFLLILLVFDLFPAGISDVPTVIGYRGRSVEIRCPYDSGYETYMKYLCRGECSTFGNKDIPVESGSTAKDQRFSLKDDTAAGVFTVTITDLRPEDAGQYWCGIKRSLPLTDVYKEIMLLVKNG
ncbi:CMRF35-like molecule 3 [Astyanax mexicanus]|uniref:CMRF35-like molecule 3 n=1 Tax=Astyanax mexicanus TaxID=7994 RepID=UPI0020CACE75|nr:CMRF35-like molecule 3 [Astyanax mexicanus]